MGKNQNKKSSRLRRSPQGGSGKKPSLPSYKYGPFSYLIIGIVIFTGMMLLQQWQSVEEIRWDEFVNHVESNYVESVTIKDTEIAGKFNEQGIASRGGKGKGTFVVYYKPEVQGEQLGKLLEKNEP